MIILGLAGQAGTGKDTIGKYLRDNYGFVMFAFSDPLYREVQEAFGLPNQELLRNRLTKELPQELLTLQQCSSDEFVKIARPLIAALHPDTFGDLDAVPLSPRHVLQWWGTDFRRVQDADYWVKQSHEFVRAIQNSVPYPEQRPQYFVECGTRFKNERDWIHALGGNVWHIYRDGIESGGQGHVSAVPLQVLEGERELWNNDDIPRLCNGVDLLLRTGAKFVKVEPMAPMVEPMECTHEFLDAGDDAICMHCGVIRSGEQTADTNAALDSNCAVAGRIQ